MAIKENREYRMSQLTDMQFRVVDEENYIVEGYATTFNDPYVLFEFDGIKYMEEIDRYALDGANMADVIFLYDHEGMVFARMSNGTLEVRPDERGLYIRADLSRTEASRRMFESIKAGMVTQMSWSFTIEEDSYNTETHTRKILKVKRVYDVSAVSIPANPNTDISARSYWDGVIAMERRSERERAAKKLRLKLMLQQKGNYGN